MNGELHTDFISDWDTWDHLVECSPEGSVFSHSTWLASLCRCTGSVLKGVGYFNGTNLIGGVAFSEVRLGPIKKATVPILTPYGGFLTIPSPDGSRESAVESMLHKTSDALMEFLTKHYHHVFLVHTPSLRDTRPFDWDGWTVKNRYTYFVELDSPEKIWERFERRTRNAIRKAEHGDFSFAIEENFPEFWELCKKTYDKQDLAVPASGSLIQKHYSTMLENDLIFTGAVKTEKGKWVAAVLFIRNGDDLCAWLSGAEPGLEDQGIMSFLYWKVMESFFDKYNRFDFLGANIPSQARFKRGFGGRLVSYPLAERYSPLWMGPLMRFATRLRGRQSFGSTTGGW